MYTDQTTVPSSVSSYAESTKYVADILSSMANGGVETSTSYVPNFLMTSGTGLTPTLTPTTLATIEQSFMDMQGSQQSGREPVTQSGFVPPVVDPGHSAEQSQDGSMADYTSSDGDYEPISKRGRMSVMSNEDIKDVNLIHTANGTINATPQRKYTRRNKDEKLPPEEEERRRVRRERNKLAAAKCRQRRVDHTNVLIDEVEELEAEGRKTEQEIAALQQEKEQLEFILQAHQPMCKMESSRGAAVTHTMLPHPPHTGPPHPSHDSHAGKSKVKAERAPPHHHLPHHQPREPTPENLSMSSSVTPPPATLRPAQDTATPQQQESSPSSSSMSSMASSRPNSLPLIKRDRTRMLSMAAATGVSINTPTSGVSVTPSALFCPGLDSMVDGSTGLTPLTGLSCSSQVTQQHRNHTSEGSSEAVGSPNLISL